MSLSNLVRRRLVVSALAAAFLLGVIQQSSTTVAAQAPDRVNVLITFASPPGLADQALVRASGGQIRYTYRLVPGMAASLPAPAVAALQNNPRIVAVEPDLAVQAYDDEYAIAWGVGRIGSQAVHAGGIIGSGVRVAVFDTGVEYTHPELSHAYAGGHDFANDDDDPFDDNGHGTHVAGSIVAAKDDAWVVGVAPGAQLYAVKILTGAGSGSFSAVIAGLEWAVDHGVQVANHSYGQSQNPGTLVAQAFANSAAAGVLHVAAAGNSGNCQGTGNNVGYPAKYETVIAVGATDELDGRPCFSSTGPAVELAAPGDWIVSTYLNNDYGVASGTSMASPHVAGAAALVMSAGVLNPTQVRNLLTSTAQDLGAAGRDKLFGYGLVNVAAAVAAAGPAPPAVRVALHTDKTFYDEAETTATLTASVTNEIGTPLSGIGFANFATTLDGAAVPVQFVETSTPGTYTGLLDISSAASGQHTVEVTVTDAQIGSDTAAFMIGTAPTAGSVGIQSIGYTGQGGADGKRDVYITLTAVDGAGARVPNAVVAVVVYLDDWPWGYGEGATDAQGQLTFLIRNAPPGRYYTEVWAVVGGGLIWDGLTPPNSFQK
jgi:subtilisin family serine protease